MAKLPTDPARGLTVIELMVVVALLGVLVALAAPSMRDMISVQRVRGVNAELVTDLQYARSEAARRNRDVSVGFQSDSTMTCYVVYVDIVVSAGAPAAGAPVSAPASACDCTLTPVCSGGPQEIKTVQLPLSNGVVLDTSSYGPLVVFSRTSGSLMPVVPGETAPNAFEVVVTGTPRGKLRTQVGRSGRPTVCSPDGSISGTPSC